MARVLVREVCPSRVFRADGERLRKAIEERWSDDEVLDVDFEGLRVNSVSFFDESFGVLAAEHPLEVLTRRLRPVNMTESDRELLNARVTERARERRRSQPPPARHDAR